MTVINTTNSVRETGNGVKTAFDFSFKMFETDEFAVFKIDTSVTPEVSTLQVLGVDYTASLLTSTEGGTITYTVAPLATEDSFISRLMDLDQPTDIPREANFPEEAIEGEFDRSRMIDIQQQADIDLKIGFAATSSTTGVTFPEPDADKAIIWNAAGTDLINSTTSFEDVITAAAASAAAAAASAAAASASASAAGVSETAAAASAAAAAASSVCASLWATEVEDTPIAVGCGGDGATTFSALHWAAKAAASAASAAALLAQFPTIVGGDAGKQLIVNVAETGYDLVTPVAGVTTFVGLSDTPANFTGNALELLRINAGETAVEFFAESAIDHDGLTNFVADEHVAHGGVTLTAGVAMTGGGTIAANRTFDVDVTSAPAGTLVAADELLFADVGSGNAVKKDTVQTILDLAAAAGGGDLTLVQHATFTTSNNVSITIEDNKHYRLVIRGALTNTGGTARWGFRFNNLSTASYQWYLKGDIMGSSQTGAYAFGQSGDNAIYVMSDVAQGINQSGNIDIFCDFSSNMNGFTGMVEGVAYFFGNTSKQMSVKFHGMGSAAFSTSINWLRIDGGNSMAGEYWLYEYAVV